MKKTIFCNIPMKEKLTAHIYRSEERSLPASERAVVYPMTAFLEKTLRPEDEVCAVLLVKKDKDGNYQRNAAVFMQELLAANEHIGARIEFKTVESEFEEEQSVHEDLLGRIVDVTEEGAHLLADITYGPKDLPIVLFVALGFAERHLGCEVDHLLYGQVEFRDGEPTNPRLCDMVPLYCLSAVTSAVCADGPQKARQMLKTLLSV